MSRRLTTEEFIYKAKEVHGETYDYSLVEYVSGKNRVKVRCKLHGVFEQISGNHLFGAGCPSCGLTKKRSLSTEEFITKSRSIHGDTYEYSRSVYTHSHTPLEIICKTHGVFLQTPSNHTRGNGCNKCGEDRTKISLEDFITKSIKAHGDIYDYSLVILHNTKSKVKIGCTKHGVFLQKPNSHLRGSGCPKCGIYKRVSILAGTMPDIGDKWKVYFLEFTGKNVTFLKIGITYKSIEKRFNTYHYRDFGIKSLMLIENLSLKEALQVESSILNKYYRYKYIFPTYVKFPGRTELLQYNTELINNIIKDLKNHEQLINPTGIL